MILESGSRQAMNEYIERYKDSGFKLTPQRLAILHFLEGNTDHPTAEDIFLAVKTNFPTISIATVYNTLQALKERGKVLELTIDPERKHYDPNTTPHHHVVCTECNEIGDIFEDYSETLQPPEYVLRRFRIAGNHVNFYGICKSCQDKKH